MRGHSRGEWYGTLDDIVESEDEAEYWALFGITHRGNKHCLAEFSSKSAAVAAKQGLRLFRDRDVPEPKHRKGGRHIAQLEVVADQNDPSMIELFALCSDGTVWHRGIGVRGGRGYVDRAWEAITLDGLEDD